MPWHWKHLAGRDCDPWSEPEGEWHRWWKGLFPEECREVVIGPHRADVVTRDEIIELQHSGITGDEIAEREAFYGERLVWVFDLAGFKDGIEITIGEQSASFCFQYPKKAIASCKRRVFIDCGGGVLIEPLRWHDSKRGFGRVHDVSWMNPGSELRGVIRRDRTPTPSLVFIRMSDVMNAASKLWSGRNTVSPTEKVLEQAVCQYCNFKMGKHIGRFLCCPKRAKGDARELQLASVGGTYVPRCTECNRLLKDHETVSISDGCLTYMSPA